MPNLFKKRDILLLIPLLWNQAALAQQSDSIRILKDVFNQHSMIENRVQTDIPTDEEHRILPPDNSGVIINARPVTAQITVTSFDPWGRPVTLTSDTGTSADIPSPARFWVSNSEHLPYGTTLQGIAHPIPRKRQTAIQWTMMTLPNGKIILLRATAKPSNKTGRIINFPHTPEQNH